MTATASGLETRSIPFPNQKQTVTAKTDDYTVTAADVAAGTIFTNTGASKAIVLTLPAISGCGGSTIAAKALAAYTISFLPQTGEKIFLHGDGVATKKAVIPATVGVYAEVYNDGTDWFVRTTNGLVTKEA